MMEKTEKLNCSKMETDLYQQNIFQSALDSFEFDDGFLMKVDLDLKEYKCNKENLSDKKKVKGPSKKDGTNGEKKKLDVKTHFYDSPLIIEDIDESQFFAAVDKKIHSLKVVTSCEKGKVIKESFPFNFMTCLSPIEGSKSRNKANISSSTPVKTTDSNSKETLNQKENSVKNSDYDFLEADLFDDWTADDDAEKNSQKSTVTLSQALKLIEEAEAARDSDQKEALNHSIDLLTGEVVGVDVGAMFDKTFSLPKSKQQDSKVSSDTVIVLDECDIKKKPSAAQKLNFEEVSVSHQKNICFNSDDDDDEFDFLTQELLKKSKKNSSSANRLKIDCPSSNSSKDYNLNESADDVVQFRKKRGKCFNVIESDSTEDSPNPKFRRKNKSNFQKTVGKEFIDSEAEVSDVVAVSSDESVEEGEYDRSFLDEESYFTQNCSANMTSKYLESVKDVNMGGSFKIPAAKPYNPINVFSQIPEDSNTDYEIDSFCVNEVEEEMNSDLSDLEVAEKILEMDRKKRKKKRLGNKEVKMKTLDLFSRV